LVQAFLKKWWVESDFKAPNLPLSIWTFLIQNNICFIKKHSFTYTRSINRTLKIPEYVMILVTSLWIQPKCYTIHLTEKSSSVNYNKYFFQILIFFSNDLSHTFLYRNRTRFRIHRPSVENALVLIVASVKYNRRSEKNIENCFL
jgi:hypothetical protein